MSNLANGIARQAADAGVSEAVRREVLSGPQLQALVIAPGGHEFKAAAERAGVNRSTLYRWIRQHAAFAAAYNAWQQEVAESARARMLAAAHLAVERVIRNMEHDQDLSFKVIKEMGIFASAADGTDQRGEGPSRDGTGAARARPAAAYSFCEAERDLRGRIGGVSHISEPIM